MEKLSFRPGVYNWLCHLSYSYAFSYVVSNTRYFSCYRSLILEWREDDAISPSAGNRLLSWTAPNPTALLQRPTTCGLRPCSLISNANCQSLLMCLVQYELTTSQHRDLGNDCPAEMWLVNARYKVTSLVGCSVLGVYYAAVNREHTCTLTSHGKRTRSLSGHHAPLQRTQRYEPHHGGELPPVLVT